MPVEIHKKRRRYDPKPQPAPLMPVVLYYGIDTRFSGLTLPATSRAYSSAERAKLDCEPGEWPSPRYDFKCWLTKTQLAQFEKDYGP